MNNKLLVKGTPISLYSKREDDYLSLTDIARYKGKHTGQIILNWLRTRFSIEFIGLWEQLHNPKFNVLEFEYIKSMSGSNSFVLTVNRWVDKTNAIGIEAKTGRYGGTYAHKDIAFEFASWISPEFKLYLIKEFQRLKEKEFENNSLEWDVKRMLAKVNYKVHTDAVKENLIPKSLSKDQISIIYANEADVLNIALYGITAKQWKEKSNKQGNIRDYSNVTQLVCLAGLESINAQYIRDGLTQKDRLVRLNEIAIIQMKSLTKSVKRLSYPKDPTSLK